MTGFFVMFKVGTCIVPLMEMTGDPSIPPDVRVRIFETAEEAKAKATWTAASFDGMTFTVYPVQP